uniref:nuclear factor NF-kappa-B p100 subunit-like n=1 Tax=Solea senegalensis TaxID=28829 RepID=UPI001CD85854|nr:nuclear factor NF-kappa-B p100 subunit-like [Solea senegalensis]
MSKTFSPLVKPTVCFRNDVSSCSRYLTVFSGADKNVENDEPLFNDSSEEDEVNDAAVPISQPISSRKRAAGHTPLDLAKCQKVRNLLNCRQSCHSNKRIKASSTEEREAGDVLDEDTLSRLVDVLSVSDVPWRKLAEKLGMMTLTHLYQDSETPCHHLLQHYKLGGGPVNSLVDALQSLGLSDGVQLLRRSETREDKHSTDATVDSGFGSQPMEEEEEPQVANQ